jgi:hypothetical protein
MAERARKTEGFHDEIPIELKRINQMHFPVTVTSGEMLSQHQEASGSV